MRIKFSMQCRRKDSFDDCPATESTSKWLITALLCVTGHSPPNSTVIAHVELIVWSVAFLCVTGHSPHNSTPNAHIELFLWSVGASELPLKWYSQCSAGWKLVSTIARNRKHFKMTDYSFVVWNRPFSTLFHPNWSCWIDHLISRCFGIAIAMKFSIHRRRKDSFDDCPATESTSI